MAFFFAVKDLLIDTHSLQSIARRGKILTIITTAGINTVEYSTEQEAEVELNKIIARIKMN